MSMNNGRAIFVAAALVVSVFTPASAKVVFTGYADLRVAPQSVSKLTGSDTVLAAVGVNDERTESRAFTTDSLGLFAATTLFDDADFLFDVTYKRIGATVGETRLQYAYFHYHPEKWEVLAGRITIPLGYYNKNYFYPFQRTAITPPVYQSAIIGLPIADNGVMLGGRFDTGPVELRGLVYAVNGYGPNRNSTDTFRAGLGVSDSLLIANNLSHTNSNKDFAYGANVRASFFPGRLLKIGASSYRGDWSQNEDEFHMLNGYVALDAGRLSVVAETLRTKTYNDKGVVGFFGARDWKSSGWFIEASYVVWQRSDSSVSLFGGTERTVAKADGTGANGEEELVGHKGGVSWQINPSVALKSQASVLDYQLPIQIGGQADRVGLVQRQVLFSLVLTY